MGRLTPPQLLIVSFISVILIGAFLLSLPAATAGEGRLSVVDSLFTATSATCVTGLIVKDTGTYFSDFGKWVIFALFQAGGLGIMTFSTLFAVLLGRKIGFRETDVIQSTLDKHRILGLNKLIRYIVTITLAAEILGAAFLYLRWRAVTSWGVAETLERSVFHSVSGFCNAGFSLFSDSLTRFVADPWINLTMMALIFLGGIGFIVTMELLGLFTRKGPKRRLSFQARTVITVSFLLIAAGAACVIFFEKDGVLKGMPWDTRILAALFQSVTARTAGFNTVDTAALSVPVLVVICALMFVGASPGSTGGGIKTSTAAVLWGTVTGMLGNRKRVMIFDRSVPRGIIREAIVIFFLAVSWIFVFTLLLTFLEKDNPAVGGGLVRPLFEVMSAFGTVGLSTGITGGLSSAGKFCLTLTMFAGRLGPLTLALAVAFRETKGTYVFPEETIMVG
ncbi:MAG: hypothetical protein GF408_01040 [Candidatus Omnitrophica bacterium]|nr:hypothetical protein [Candidatus Omnitrophota bacterium]